MGQHLLQPAQGQTGLPWTYGGSLWSHLPFMGLTQPGLGPGSYGNDY